MKKSVFTLLVLLACTLSPLHAYEYFTIYFTDGTKSGAFYATDVECISYSKLDIDGVEHADWQVQEIYTCDSVYRYPLACIENLSFTDVDENRVAEDIDRANSYIAPLYLQSNDATELSTRLSMISDIEGVDGFWADHQTLFVKIRDYGTISYIYPPAMKAGGIEFNYQRNLSRRTANASNEHQHTNINKACIYNQTSKDENPFFDEARNTQEEVFNMYKCMGIACESLTDLHPSFFVDEIYNYDHVFLITHGEYDKERNLHWLYTNEELLCVNDSKWINNKQAWLKFISKYRTLSSNKLGIGVHKEIRNGKTCVVYYTKLSEKYISSSSHHFNNVGNTVIFNTACQSLKDNDNMAMAFQRKGAGCYMGYTETNDIGHNGGEYFFASMLNAQCIRSAKECIPTDWQEETWVNKTTGEEIPVKLKKIVFNKWVDDICIIDPETLDAEETKNNVSTVTLKGRIKMVLPSLMDKYEVGFVFADNKEMNDTIHHVVLGDYDESTRYMSFEKTLDIDTFQPNTTYYYQAYMNDGNSYCYGEIRSTAPPVPYCVLKNSTLTFYYDGTKESREGIVFEVEDNYYNWNEEYSNEKLPQWYEYRNQIVTTAFDSSFKDYRPQSTAFWFYDLAKITQIRNLDNLKTDSVTDMSYMFAFCYSLASIDMSSFNTSNVTNMSYMFYYCSSLKSLDVSNFSTSNVMVMSSMFSGCKTLTSLDLKKINFSKVENLQTMLGYCDSLERIEFDDVIYLPNVREMTSLFCGCHSLKDIELNFHIPTNCRISGMFSGCTSLRTCKINGLLSSSDYSYMFSDCSSLITCEINIENEIKIEKTNGMFSKCASLKLFSFINNSKQSKIKLSDTFGAGPSCPRNFEIKIEATNVCIQRLLTRGTDAIGWKFNIFADAIDIAWMLDTDYNWSQAENYNLENWTLNLNANNIITISWLISDVGYLKTLDLSGWNISLNSPKFESQHIIYSHTLTTIYGNNFKITGVSPEKIYMFLCPNLVGGMGTKVGGNIYYDENGRQNSYYCPADARAAHIDGGKDNPGLFTAK